jgi:DNA repair protein RadC
MDTYTSIPDYAKIKYSNVSCELGSQMDYENRIKEMPDEQRPYERCERFGASSLTDIELLAVLLRTGSRGESSLQLAEKLLAPTALRGGIINLHHWTYEKLRQVKGIGKVKAIQMVCLIELAKRLAKADASYELEFSKPSTIAQYYMEDMRHAQQEVMKLLLLNTKSKLIGERDMSIGTINSAVISPRELFVEALQRNAVSIIMLHNHPSGDPTPSKEDILVTRRVGQAGELIGIHLLDHIIIGDNCYISMRERALI